MTSPIGYDFCCSATDFGCCPSGCIPTAASGCCGQGYCDPGEGCCEDMACYPLDAQCCADGGYCPDPFICVKDLDTGNIGCCTDLKCNVYLSAGQTVTYSPSTRYTTFTDTYYTTRATTYRTTNLISYYQWYYTTIYWYAYAVTVVMSLLMSREGHTGTISTRSITHLRHIPQGKAQQLP